MIFLPSQMRLLMEIINYNLLYIYIYVCVCVCVQVIISVRVITSMNLSKDLLSLESSKEFWKIMMVLYNTNEHLCVCVCVCVCVSVLISVRVITSMNSSKDLISLESSKEFWKILMVLYNTNEHSPTNLILLESFKEF